MFPHPPMPGLSFSMPLSMGNLLQPSGGVFQPFGPLHTKQTFGHAGFAGTSSEGFGGPQMQSPPGLQQPQQSQQPAQPPPPPIGVAGPYGIGQHPGLSLPTPPPGPIGNGGQFPEPVRYDDPTMPSVPGPSGGSGNDGNGGPPGGGGGYQGGNGGHRPHGGKGNGQQPFVGENADVATMLRALTNSSVNTSRMLYSLGGMVQDHYTRHQANQGFR